MPHGRAVELSHRPDNEVGDGKPMMKGVPECQQALDLESSPEGFRAAGELTKSPQLSVHLVVLERILCAVEDFEPHELSRRDLVSVEVAAPKVLDIRVTGPVPGTGVGEEQHLSGRWAPNLGEDLGPEVEAAAGFQTLREAAPEGGFHDLVEGGLNRVSETLRPQNLPGLPEKLVVDLYRCTPFHGVRVYRAVPVSYISSLKPAGSPAYTAGRRAS